MIRGISWEQLHDQISELLPLLSPEVARVAGRALAQGRAVREGGGTAVRPLEEVLDQVATMRTTTTLTPPECALLAAVQDLLVGLLSSAVLSSQLVAAWPKVQGARRALAARSDPACPDPAREPGDERRPRAASWVPRSAHEAVGIATARRG
jgi:hypothetical protein